MRVSVLSQALSTQSGFFPGAWLNTTWVRSPPEAHKHPPERVVVYSSARSLARRLGDLPLSLSHHSKSFAYLAL